MTPEEIQEQVKAKILARRAMFEDQRIPFKSVGKIAAEKYLTTLIELTFNLRNHLRHMPLEVRETGALFPGDLEGFGFELEDKLCWPAVAALKIIEGKPGRKGNRVNRKAEFAAWLIAETYEEVAGTPPTLNEEQFMLEVLFPELGINAKSELSLIHI